MLTTIFRPTLRLRVFVCLLVLLAMAIGGYVVSSSPSRGILSPDVVISRDHPDGELYGGPARWVGRRAGQRHKFGRHCAHCHSDKRHVHRHADCWTNRQRDLSSASRRHGRERHAIVHHNNERGRHDLRPCCPDLRDGQLPVGWPGHIGGEQFTAQRPASRFSAHLQYLHVVN